MPFPDDDDLAPPVYLTNPGRAIAERQHWENRFTALLTETLKGEQTRHEPDPAEPNSLTASIVFPDWHVVVDHVIEALPPLPRWAESWLRGVEARVGDDVVAHAEMAARLAPTLATASYNTHVLAWLARTGTLYKQWVTRRDARVRHAHALTDRQVQPLSSPFVMVGYLLQFPGDASTAPIELWINCRCVLIGVETAPQRA